MNDDIVLVPDFARVDAILRAALTGATPTFVSRIGGSDTDLVARVLAACGRIGWRAALEAEPQALDLAQRFNGLYATGDLIDAAERFCRTLLAGYLRAPLTFLCNPPLLTHFLPETIDPTHRAFPADLGPMLVTLMDLAARAARPLTAMPYAYIERTTHGQHSLFRLFADILPGKTVLVVSPLTRSIRANWPNRHRFFRDYAYPEFRLLCQTTPITYAGLPAAMYPDADWSATAERLAREIATIDFDIALLCCGSYAMRLGDFIAHRLGRPAIYVGGCLQLFFGIMGRRYEDPFFLDVINREHFIAPVETDEYAPHMAVTTDTPKDAFGAYF